MNAGGGMLKAGLITAGLTLACSGAESDDGFGADDIGSLQLALTQVPADAKCIRLTSDAAGRRTTLSATLTPGAAAFSTTFAGLPVGSMTLWADIFNVACSSVTVTSVATWISPPVQAMTASASTPNITLVVQRPSGLAVGVDFCTTTPCATCNPGFHSCAGECVSNSSVLSCGSSCAPCATPANGKATCSGTSCGVSCNPGFHACGSSCRADTDAQSCGSACVSCSQPNATAVCSGGVCANVCVGSAYSCPGAAPGKPACARWNFESTTTEGFSVVEAPAGANVTVTGALSTSNVRAVLGSRSLAIPIRMVAGGNTEAAITVKPCPGGQPVSAPGKTLQFKAFFQPAAGTACSVANEMYVQLMDGSNILFAGADISASCNAWTEFSMLLQPFAAPSVTEIQLVFRAFTNWTGTVFVDDFRFE